MRVRVYKNLHKNMWSIQHKRRVVGHCLIVELRDVSLIVLPGGYARYQKTGVKNVHAFVEGELVSVDAPVPTGTEELVYSPKQPIPMFMSKTTGLYYSRNQVIPRVVLDNGKVWM